MQLTRHPANPILVARPEIEWEAGGVFNACVVRDGDIFHMVYRALRSGFERLPDHPDGWRRYDNFVSSIGYASSTDGINFVARDTPLIEPEHDYEIFGVEDPRVVKIGDTFYVHYTAIRGPAYRGMNETGVDHIRIALASTEDFVAIKKHGIVGPSIESGMDSKAGVFLPTENDRVGMYLTINSSSPESSVIYYEFDSIELATKQSDHWNEVLIDPSGHVVQSPSAEGTGFEVGAPAVETDAGLLFIYSRISKNQKWSIGAALIDKSNPSEITHDLPDPILEPETPIELEGIVDNVVFPEGAVVVNDQLYVYYGAADTCVCLATCNLDELLTELQKHPV